MLVGFETTALYQAGVDIDVYRTVAQKGEALGFDSFWLGGHIVLPKTLSPLPPEDPNKTLSLTDPATVSEWARRNAEKSAKDGNNRHDSNGHKLDPWTLFSHLAGLTTTLRFASGIFILPLVNPFVTARALTTADIVSGGRIIVGIGVGWCPEEFAIVGEDFHTRGKRADEIIEILQKLWTEDTIEYHGKHYSFPPVQFAPKPVQRPHPPILGGGLTPPAIRRAARLNGCWMPINDIELIKSLLADIKQIREADGLSNEPYDVTVHAPLPLTKDTLRRFEDIGVTRVVAVIGAPPSVEGAAATAGSIPPTSAGSIATTAKGFCDNLEQIAERVLI